MRHSYRSRSAHRAAERPDTRECGIAAKHCQSVPGEPFFRAGGHGAVRTLRQPFPCQYEIRSRWPNASVTSAHVWAAGRETGPCLSYSLAYGPIWQMVAVSRLANRVVTAYRHRESGAATRIRSTSPHSGRSFRDIRSNDKAPEQQQHLFNQNVRALLYRHH